jgi:hypothetical protein
MKKFNSIFILVWVMFHLMRCHPGEEIIPEPIMLSVIVNNVSKYSGHNGSIDLTNVSFAVLHTSEPGVSDGKDE